MDYRNHGIGIKAGETLQHVFLGFLNLVRGMSQWCLAVERRYRKHPPHNVTTGHQMRTAVESLTSACLYFYRSGRAHSVAHRIGWSMRSMCLAFCMAHYGFHLIKFAKCRMTDSLHQGLAISYLMLAIRAMHMSCTYSMGSVKMSLYAAIEVEGLMRVLEALAEHYLLPMQHSIMRITKDIDAREPRNERATLMCGIPYHVFRSLPERAVFALCIRIAQKKRPHAKAGGKGMCAVY